MKHATLHPLPFVLSLDILSMSLGSVVVWLHCCAAPSRYVGRVLDCAPKLGRPLSLPPPSGRVICQDIGNNRTLQVFNSHYHPTSRNHYKNKTPSPFHCSFNPQPQQCLSQYSHVPSLNRRCSFKETHLTAYKQTLQPSHKRVTLYITLESHLAPAIST